MTITAKATLVAMRFPLTVEKDGQRYSLDIADDSEGVDLVVERAGEAKARGEGQEEVKGKGQGQEEVKGKGQGQQWNLAIFFLLFASMLVSLSSFADRTASREWVARNYVNRTNEWKLAERRHALFILDLNAENNGSWRAFELKASTNNFSKTAGETARMCFWGCSDEADGYSDAVLPITANRGEDRMRLYWLTTRGETGRDGRAWTKIATTLELTGAYPKRLGVLLSPELCQDGGWLGEENEDVVWCYTRADASGPEKDTNGAVIWHPIHPVRWYRSLPEWAGE